MLFEFGGVLAMFVIGIGFILVSLLLGSLLRPKRPEHNKGLGYECGEMPSTDAWFNFNPRFYIVALIFLIFDVELAFMYPVATVFRRWVAEGRAGTALLEILIFAGILVVGLAYVMVKGDLEWVRKIRKQATAGPEGPRELL